MADRLDEIKKSNVHVFRNGVLDNESWLIAEVVRLREALQRCACGVDYPDDVCLVHSPIVQQQQAEIVRLREALTAQDGQVARMDAEIVRLREEAEVWRLDHERVGELYELASDRANAAEAEILRLREALTAAEGLVDACAKALRGDYPEVLRDFDSLPAEIERVCQERDDANEELLAAREALTAAEAALAVKRAKAAMFESWIRTNHPDAEILAENIVAAASDGHEHVWQDTGFANLDDCAVCGKTRVSAASDGEAE
jgi:small-conductance mechanosensitive channel